MSEPTWRIIEGDCIEVMRELPAESVQTCITSPPYWGLRDYGVEGQLGLEPTPEEYVANLVAVFREVWRVLRPDGTLWLNLGDSYAAANASGPQGKTGDRANRTFTATTTPKMGPGLKPKDLVGIPWLVAFALRADGWYLRSDIIWAKPNPMPESVTDRPTKAHEYIFLLSKSPRYYYDANAIREPDSGKSSGNGFVRDYRLSYQNADGTGRGRDEQWEPGGGRNKRSVWTVASQPFSGAHFATFPPALIEPCILAGSPPQACAECGAPYLRQTERRSLDRSDLPPEHPEYRPRRYDDGKAGDPQAPGPGQRFTEVRTIGWAPTCSCGGSLPTRPATVLDPFAGSGTTGLVALRHNRSFVGVELNPDYAEMARNRIRDDAPLLNVGAEVA